VLELDVDLDGQVHYADFGGHGKPIVLIHGLGGSRLNWLAVAPGLAEDNRVYAIDLIGHGLTPRAGRKATLANHRTERRRSRLRNRGTSPSRAGPTCVVRPAGGGG